jgi:hypothetical protein
MRTLIRSLGATIVALLGVIVLAIAWTATTAVQLAATALIMGGTGHPLGTPPEDPLSYINPYLDNAINGFINPAAAAPTGTGNAPIAAVGLGDDRYAIITPEQFFPVSGSMTFDDSVAIGLANLDSCLRGTGCQYNDNALLSPAAPAAPPVPGDEFDIFGYSQSAVIASLEKQAAIDNPGQLPNLHFFLLANPMRPNGGFLSRGPNGLTIPFLGVTFYGATPTNSCEVGDCLETVDVAAQYDGLGGDAAVGLTNVLAVVNAAMGYFLLHGNLQNSNFDNALYQGSYGDTDYYLVPTPRLPVLMPFDPIVPSPILTAVDTIIRPIIEGAYRRDINPGVPVGVGLLPFQNPVQTLVNVLVAIPTAVDDAVAEATGNSSFRPLGTKPVTSPFGVGGPDLPAPPSETNLTAFAKSDGAGDKKAADEGARAVQTLAADTKGDADAKDKAGTGDSQDHGTSTINADNGDDAIKAGRQQEDTQGPSGDATEGQNTATSKPSATSGTGQQPEAPSDPGPAAGQTTGGNPGSDTGNTDAGGAAAA